MLGMGRAMSKQRRAEETASSFSKTSQIFSYLIWAKVGQSSLLIWRRPSLSKWTLADISKEFFVAMILSST
jgi:hypothetical protein